MDDGIMTSAGWGLLVIILLVFYFRAVAKGQAETAVLALDLHERGEECRRLKAEIEALRSGRSNDIALAAHTRDALSMYELGDFTAEETLALLANSLDTTGRPRPPHYPR